MRRHANPKTTTRHGWDEALHTLLHEMVHLWQWASGGKVDHGTTFRTKAKEVGL